MRTHGFHHLAIQARDVEKTTAFYRDALGLPEQVRHLSPDGSLRSVWLSVPGGGFLAIEACEGEPHADHFRTARAGLHLFALRIERSDREAVERELGERGVPVIFRTAFTLYVRDPEGNRVGLSHHPHEAA